MGTTSAQRQAELRERAKALLVNTDATAFAAASKAQLIEAISRAAGKEPNPVALDLAARALLERIGGTLEPVTVTMPDPRVAILNADLYSRWNTHLPLAPWSRRASGLQKNL